MALISKILPVNNKPTINTYADLSYVNAILEASDVLKVEVLDWKSKDWEFCNALGLFETENGFLIQDSFDDKNIEGILLNKNKNEDKVIIHIDYYRQLENTSYIDLFYIDSDLSNEKLTYAITNYGFYKEGTLFKYTKKYTWFKIQKREGKLLLYASENGLQWDSVFLEDNSFSYKNDNGSFGIKYSLGSRQLMAWNSMNYLQLCLDLNDVYGERWLNYYMFPKKSYDYLYGIYNYFFDVQYFRYDEICNIYGTIDNFIKVNICMGDYILMSLDEYYISERRSYNQEHYEHDNLIYGYDSQNYYVLGYNQKTVSSTFPIDRLKISCCKERKIIRYRLATNEYKFQFDLQSFLATLREFIDGIDSSKRYSNILSQRKATYGLEVFQVLLKNNQGIELLMTDQRITYLLKEHCELMYRRLKYLISAGYIRNKSSSAFLLKKCQEMVKQATELFFMFLKYKVSGRGRDNILPKMQKLYEYERLFYLNLYEELSTIQNKSV